MDIMKKLNSALLFVSSALLALSTSCNTPKIVSDVNVNKTLSDKIISNIAFDNNAFSNATSTNQRLEDVLSKYKSTILPVPNITKVIAGDTVDFSLNFFFSDYTYISKHNKVVMRNAMKLCPESKNYLPAIFHACYLSSDIFPVPSETIVALLYEKTKFNPNASASNDKFGIALFSAPTALKMDIYVSQKWNYPDIRLLETKLIKVHKERSSIRSIADKHFKNNDFELAKTYELLADSLEQIEKLTSKEYTVASYGIKEFSVIKSHGDERFVPELVIPKFVELLAGLAKTCKDKYHCSDERAIDWAIEKYEEGLNFSSAIRPSTKTAALSRSVDKLEAKLFSRPVTEFILEDFAKIVLDTVVQKNAIRLLPKSKPYLEIIFNACYINSRIFPVPPKTMISVLKLESDFNNTALSVDDALGMAQFISGTAQYFGLQVLHENDFPDLSKIKSELKLIRNKFYATKYDAYKTFHDNNFEIAINKKKFLDDLEKQMNLVTKSYEELFAHINSIYGSTNKRDDRIEPQLAIFKATTYVASSAKRYRAQYGVSDEKALEFAIEAYNAGNVLYDPVAETIAYKRMIIMLEDKLSFNKF
jgi:hypothetical protein